MNFSTALTLTLALTAAWTITSAASQSTKMSKKGKDNKNKPKRDDNTLTRGNSDCIAGGNRTTDISCIGSGFCVGSCGDRVSADPRVFGPVVWPSLHYMSVNYPEKPNNQTQTACENFVRALPYMLPCPHCGWHLNEFIELNDKLSGEDPYNQECAGAQGESCQSIWDVCASKSNLISFFARAHNNVNLNTHPCRELWSSQDVKDKYTQTNICASNIVWGQCELNREEDDNFCCSPNSEYFLLPGAGLGNPCKSTDGSECVRQPACFAEPTEDGTIPDGRAFYTTNTVSAVDVKGCKDDNGKLVTCPETHYVEGELFV